MRHHLKVKLSDLNLEKEWYCLCTRGELWKPAASISGTNCINLCYNNHSLYPFLNLKPNNVVDRKKPLHSGAASAAEGK
jgi:hypothetical protein